MAHEVGVLSRRGRAMRWVLGGYAVCLYVFLFAPIVLLILFSFNANRYGTFPITGWTLSWYRQAINDYQIRDALSTTLRIAAEVTLISTVVGTAAAFPLIRARLRFRDGIRVGFMLPIMIPGLLIGVSLLVLFTGTLGMDLSPQTAVIGQSVYTTPFVILLVAARLQGFDASLERAASDLGANTFQRLRLIVLPLILPAVLAGALFAFTLSLDEFIITYFLIGANVTLPIFIYTQIKFGITPEVNAVATMLLAGSLTLLALAFTLPILVRGTRRMVRGRSAANLLAQPAVVSGQGSGTGVQSPDRRG
jgi:spermidine/putrescine transport system permease protein